MEDRFDLVFSYWIFAWWVLYALKVTHYSPKLWIGVGVAYELFLLVVLVVNQYPPLYIGLFVFVNLIIKVWPLWTMRRETRWEFWPGAALFIVYLGWMYVNGDSVSARAARNMRQIKKGKPFSAAIANILKIFAPNEI